MGLAKFGKGDWRSISRSFVMSRTPTQVPRATTLSFNSRIHWSIQRRMEDGCWDVLCLRADSQQSAPPLSVARHPASHAREHALL